MKVNSASYLRPLIGQKSDHKPSATRIRPSHSLVGKLQSPHHPLRRQAEPLCTFGPGGEYVVDWFAGQGRQTAFPEREKAVIIPASAGSGEPLKAGDCGRNDAQTRPIGLKPLQLLSEELKRLFSGDHPGRVLRADAHPHWMAPCVACGQHNQYSPWTRNALPQPGPRPRSAILHLGITAAESNYHSMARPFTSSGRSLTEVSDQLFPEMTYESNPQTTQNPASDRRLASEGGLFPDDAGIGRSTRRVESHRFRARTGAGAKRASGSTETQGSLFEPQPTS
jgi:hypothetical protein